MNEQTQKPIETNNKTHDKLDKLVILYATIRNVDPERFSKNISSTLSVSHDFNRKLKERGISKELFLGYNERLSAEKNYENLVRMNPLDSLKKNKELCLEYIRFLKSVGDYHLKHYGAKSTIKKQISEKDPMLLKYLDYKIAEIKCRKTLEKYLVKETVESLGKRYKKYVELIEKL